MEVNKKLIGLALAVVLLLSAVVANSGELGLAEFVAFLAGTTALGAVSSLAVAAIRIAIPAIDSDYAMFFSIGIAVAINTLAKALLPYVPDLSPALYDLWPSLTWLAQQLWYYVNPELDLNRRASKASDMYYGRL